MDVLSQIPADEKIILLLIFYVMIRDVLAPLVKSVTKTAPPGRGDELAAIAMTLGEINGRFKRYLSDVESEKGTRARANTHLHERMTDMAREIHERFDGVQRQAREYFEELIKKVPGCG